jgi:hypothetical protein
MIDQLRDQINTGLHRPGADVTTTAMRRLDFQVPCGVYLT